MSKEMAKAILDAHKSSGACPMCGMSKFADGGEVDESDLPSGTALPDEKVASSDVKKPEKKAADTSAPLHPFTPAVAPKMVNMTGGYADGGEIEDPIESAIKRRKSQKAPNLGISQYLKTKMSPK
jgi:hypothetical protein